VSGLLERHAYPGKLIVVEGIDGSGKSTQLSLVHRWLESD
jgi:dTMP kinase